MAKISVIMILLISILLIAFFFGREDCQYANRNGSFTYEEMNAKGRDFETCLRKWKEFKKVNKSDTVLYRLCRRHPWKIWNYGSYLLSQRYKLPYMPYEEVMRNRGHHVNLSGFQDF